MSTDAFDVIIGTSAAAQAMRTFGSRAAAVDAPVLLLGESGTGKGVLARAIHRASARAARPFVAVNCAAVPESLFESEFFGHVRGAFTGAQYAHRGLFEQADSGTLFLDEVGDLPLPMQAKLLTVLEDGEVRRVGAERVAPVNVRIIAATAADLQVALTTRTFRRDLFHRLSVMTFEIAPLRHRAGDIPEIAAKVLRDLETRYHMRAAGISAEFLQRLLQHAWPGNIRELAHVLEASFVNPGTELFTCSGTPLPAAAPVNRHADERDRILCALRAAGGNKQQAARSLGVARNTLYNRIRRLGLDV